MNCEVRLFQKRGRPKNASTILTALSGQDKHAIVRRTLLHALFPLVRAEILQLLFTNPKQELFTRELARLSFLSLQTVQDELAKLSTAKLVLSRSNGYHRFYRANPAHPLYAALRKMVVQSASHPRPVVRSRRSVAHRRHR